MSDHALPPSDDPTPPPEPDGRSGPHTPHSPSPGPPTWTNVPDPLEPFDPPIGGRYQAHSFHKPGGMGRVWRAHDTELGRDVAFKEIRPKYANDESARRRFVFEAEVTGRLEHPAVIPVYGFGHDAQGRPYYAMRFVEGKSLQEAIAEFYAPDGPTGAERAVALRRLLGHFVTVCRAIDYAHSRGVIHRDLKPANIMVGDFGETLVVDWGVAKRLRVGAGEEETAVTGPVPPEALADPHNSHTGDRIGTKPYWSPEQAAGVPDEHDERTDVYGLGAVLFAILTGTPPNPPTGVHWPEPPGPRAQCPWVDAGIDEITRTALALDRKDRYQTAAAVAQAVELWLADQPLLAQRGAVEALGRAADDHPTDLTLAEQFARQRSNLGLMLAGMGRDADAVGELWLAANLFARLADESHQPRLSAEEANCLLALARSLGTLGRNEEAKTAEQEAAGIYKKLIATQPEVYKPGFDAIMMSASQVEFELPKGLEPGGSAAEISVGIDFLAASDPDLAVPPVGPPQLAPPNSDIDLGAIAPPDTRTRELSDPLLRLEPVTLPAGFGSPPEPSPPTLSALESVSVPDIDTLFPSVGRTAPPGAFRAGDHAIAEFELPPVPPDFFDRDPPSGPDDSVPDIDSVFSSAALPGRSSAPGAFLGLSSGYTRVRDLAQSGMSRLYLARDETLNRLVVIKTLADAHAANSRAAHRFRREVQITGSLEHPNLVRAYASGTDTSGRPYLVLEYLNGGTLMSRFGAYGPGWSAALLDPLAQVADGLHHAHIRGIVHRDAKLSNVIVLPLGRTVLLDWGLGKVIGQPDGLDSGIGPPSADPVADDPMRSRAGALVGTPAYMAPEQARGDGGAIGPRTDVFTLGADLFHLVTGHPPGHQYDLRELIARRRTGDGPRLRDVRPDAPRELDAICARAMAFRPEDRYPTAAALAADIRAFLATQADKQ